MADLITSASNPLVKRMRALSDRKNRRRESAFVVHGVQPVWRAVESDFRVDTLVIAPGTLTHEPTLAMVAQAEAAGTPVARLSDALFDRITDRDRPAGIAAIVSQRWTALTKLSTAPDALFIALDHVGNPGNLGTVLRTAEAVAADGLILVGATCDPFDPTSVKASMGAVFNVSVARAHDVEEFFGWARRASVTVAAATGGASDDYRAAEYPAPLALLLGSEGTGLSNADIDRSDLRLRIPMTGKAESLNLAVAAGLLLYQARQAIAPEKLGA